MIPSWKLQSVVSKLYSSLAGKQVQVRRITEAATGRQCEKDPFLPSYPMKVNSNLHHQVIIELSTYSETSNSELLHDFQPHSILSRQNAHRFRLCCLLWTGQESWHSGDVSRRYWYLPTCCTMVYKEDLRQLFECCRFKLVQDSMLKLGYRHYHGCWYSSHALSSTLAVGINPYSDPSHPHPWAILTVSIGSGWVSNGAQAIQAAVSASQAFSQWNVSSISGRSK